MNTILLTTILLSSTAQVAGQSIIWTSNGGGWRSMSSVMGYANAFYQSGLITDDSSQFEAIATNSGSSWFSTQFFFSETFFNLTTQSTPEELNKLVVGWMESYEKLLDRGLHNTGIHSCDRFSFVANTIHTADLFDCMLRVAADGYGDATWPDRKVSSENRVAAMSGTNLNIQSAIIPSFRIRRVGRRDLVTFWGPNNSSNGFTINIATQLVVNDDGTEWLIAIEDEDLPLKGSVTAAPITYHPEDWSNFPLYPPSSDASIYSDGLPGPIRETVALRDNFFGGEPSAIQAALAGAMATSQFDASGGSTFAQFISTQPPIRRFALSKFLYRKGDRLSSFGICTQWPDKCDERDLHLGDGGSADGSAVALTLGNHQKANGYNVGTPLKLIVTFTYFTRDKDAKFLTYFDTDFNQDVAPGDFVWAPSTSNPENNPQPNPWRSQQVFAESLNQTLMDDLRQANPTSHPDSSAVPFTVTTIDNPAYGVVAGQTVHMLWLTYYSPVETNIARLRKLRKFIGPTGEIAENLASDADLQTALATFMAL